MTHNGRPEQGKPILIHVGGRELELKFPLRILKKMDAEAGISVLKGVGFGAAFTDPEKLAMILHYGVQSRHPDITLAWIEEEVDASMLLTLGPLLAYATSGRWPKIGIPEDEDTIAKNGDQMEAITGLPSGPSGDMTFDLQTVNSGS